MKTLHLLTFVTLCCPYFVFGQNKVSYNIVADDPSPKGIANVFVSSQLSFDMPFLGRMDKKMDAINALSFGSGLNVHAIVLQNFLVDAHYYLGDNFGDQKSLLSKKFNVGGGYIFKSSLNKKKIKVKLSERTYVNNKGQRMRETSSAYIPGHVFAYSAIRGGLYFINSGFEGNFSNEKIIGNSQHAGIYVGYGLGRIVNLQTTIGERALKRGSQIYHRFYGDIILNPGRTTIINGNPNADIKARAAGFRAGWDIYKPTVGLMAPSYRGEFGYQPGYNGFYLQCGVGFTIRGRVNALVGEEKKKASRDKNDN